MLVKLYIALLTLTLTLPYTSFAEDLIRVSVEDGKKRAEFQLNGDLACVLENQKIVCTPASR